MVQDKGGSMIVGEDIERSSWVTAGPFDPKNFQTPGAVHILREHLLQVDKADDLHLAEIGVVKNLSQISKDDLFAEYKIENDSNGASILSLERTALDELVRANKYSDLFLLFKTKEYGSVGLKLNQGALSQKPTRFTNSQHWHNPKLLRGVNCTYYDKFGAGGFRKPLDIFFGSQTTPRTILEEFIRPGGNISREKAQLDSLKVYKLTAKSSLRPIP